MMTSTRDLIAAARAALASANPSRDSRRHITLIAAVSALGLAAVVALAPPPPPTAAEAIHAYVVAHAQTLTVENAAAVAPVARDAYSATPGIQTLAAGGTNYDWAKLVLVLGSFPMTESNVTVLTRWMRQENGADNWWNRNNPLNNGWGSGGGGGTGSYDSLVIAAENAAAALRANAGYSGIVAALDGGAPSDQLERAIWDSPWASGHYANGGHWSYVPVPVVKSPSGTW
jgi:hypothetical protein